MREILFRGKRTDNGQWVEGYYFTTPLTNENIMVPIEDGHYFMCGIQRHVIARNGAVFEVDRDTVGQYTELPDKNGKRIFEGDVVEVATEYYGNAQKHRIVVKWDNDIENDSFGEPLTCGYCIHGFNWEIIGNITDNPELVTP